MKERIFYTFDPYDDYPWKVSVKESYEDGVRIFSFLYPMMITWREDGSFDFSVIDTLTDRIAALIPEGRMMPRAFLTTPYWWDKRYPAELLKFSGPVPRQADFTHVNAPLWKYESKMFHGSDNPSLASEQWKTDAGNAVYATVKHLVERYGRKRIYAIQLAYGTCGEWGQFGSYLFGQSANGDYSEPMVRAYRNSLREKYGDRPEFGTILPPGKADRQKTEAGMLRSPSFIRCYLDYLETVARVKNQALAHFCRRAKEACPDMLCGSFGGSAMSVGSSAYSLNNGNVFDSRYLMQIKELDFISTPNNYFNKRQGSTFSHTPVRTAVLHKRFIAECDTRSELADNSWAPAKGFSDAQFLRETSFNLLTSGYLWHYDFGLHWYALPEVREIRRKLLAMDPAIFDDRPQAQIAVVADPESLLCTSGATGYYRQFGETLTGQLSRCGAFADHIVMDDLFNLPPYRLYIFRDAFINRPELRDFLRENRSSALWLGPAGCVTEDRVDISLAEKQTSFRLNAADHVAAPNTVTLRGGHFLTSGIPLPFTPSGVEDLNALWSPVLYADPDADCEVAGLVESLDLPGLVSRGSEGRYDVWSASPLVPAGVLRNLAQAAGVDLRILGGDAEIYGAGNTFAIRIMSNEPLVIRSNGFLTDLMSGEKCEPRNGQITFCGKKGKAYLFREE
ncbi:MAG: hypothetical protein J5944_07690 [Lentisphaeria bacterium]|nr:hypothetical protein [Lentisphaeria bacterium]